MTEKLYEADSLLKECSSIVISCRKEKEKFLVELDKTVFFPEGGGQLSDRGKLADAEVSYVFEKDGHIYHECSKALEEGSKVIAAIDWKVRLDRMQQHTGEHLLSYAFWKLYGLHNVGFHMNETTVTIDLDGEVSREQLAAAEMLTNEIIWDNRPVKIYYLDSSEAAKIPMRKFNHNLQGNLRIVDVEGADVCTCCGTHPPYTGMVGCVKIIRSEKHKQGSRIEFLCGRRALLDADMKNTVLLAAAAEFSAKPEGVYEKVLKLKAELAQCQEALKRQRLKMLQERFAALHAEAAEYSAVRFVDMVTDDSGDIKLLQQVVSAQADTVSIIAAVQGDRISYAVMSTCADFSCRCAVKVLNEAFGGRGGGKDDCAQGSALYCADWQEKWAAAVAVIRQIS